MELRPSYRRGPAESAPNVWKLVSLDACIRPGAPICYGILMPGSHRDNGVPVVKVRDIVDGCIDESDLLLTHPLIDEAYERSRLISGDVLVTIRGTTGRVAIVSSRLNGANITQDTARLRIRDGVDPGYVYFALQSEPLQHQIALHTIGQAVKGINIRDVRNLALGLPELDEQHAIASALSDVDALLGGLARLIAKKRDLKQAAMQQLLTGETRLPGFQGEWITERLSALCSMKSGEGITSNAIGDDGEYPCYGGNGLRGFTARFTHSGRYALIGRQGALCGNVTLVKGMFFASEHAIVVTALPDIDIGWLSYVLRELRLNRISESSAQPGLSVAKLANIEVVVPPTAKEQTAIATVLSDLDAELAALEARRDKTRALKQAMMQELLTGRTRLVTVGSRGGAEDAEGA